MEITPKTLAQGVLTNTPGTVLYTVPSGKTAIIKTATFVNTDGSAATLNYIKDDGSNAVHLAPVAHSLATGLAYIDANLHVLEAGYTLKGDSGTDAAMEFTIEGYEQEAEEQS